MNIELIRWPTEADWIMAKRCALVTVGKDSETPPSEEWKRRSLEARHSYIRELPFVFRITGIPYWVAMHLVRHHVGCQPYIKTQRNDRQKIYDRGDAPQNTPVDMMWSMNAEGPYDHSKQAALQAGSYGDKKSGNDHVPSCFASMPGVYRDVRPHVRLSRREVL